MPADLASGFPEDLFSRVAGVCQVGMEPVDHSIVKTEHRYMKLREDHVMFQEFRDPGFNHCFPA
jgi:hypothetical protein